VKGWYFVDTVAWKVTLRLRNESGNNVVIESRLSDGTILRGSALWNSPQELDKAVRQHGEACASYDPQVMKRVKAEARRQMQSAVAEYSHKDG